MKTLPVLHLEEDSDWMHSLPGYADEVELTRIGVAIAAGLKIIKRGGKGSGHFDHEGRPGKRGGSAPSGRSLFIGVPAGAVPFGEEAFRMRRPQPEQSSGAPIRGRAISWEAANLPDTVYHMTTNLPGIEESGVIFARGVGGLGGDDRDQIVSMTISEEVAQSLVRDTRFSIEVAREFVHDEPHFHYEEGVGWRSEDDAATRDWQERLVKVLDAEARKHGFEFDEGWIEMSNTWGLQDWMRQWYVARASRTGVRNPLFFTPYATLAKYDPAKVGYIRIPRENLNTGALLTDFDLGQNFLEEIRLYGDVPVDNAEFIIRGGAGSGHHDHKGRPGKRGGSAPRDISSDLSTAYSIGEKYRGEFQSFNEAIRYDNFYSDVDGFDEFELTAVMAGMLGKDRPYMVTGWRYGKIPKSGKSWNSRDKRFEMGVSVMELDGIRTPDSDPYSALFFVDRPRFRVQGWLNTVGRGADGEPLIMYAEEIEESG